MSRRGGQGGFTLVEAIVAMVILSLAVPPLLWSIKEGERKSVMPARAAAARLLVAEKIEDVLADRHSSTRGYGYVVNGNYPAESPVAGFAGFTRTVTVTETNAALAPTSGGGYKQVVVAVTTSDGSTSQTWTSTVVVTQY